MLPPGDDTVAPAADARNSTASVDANEPRVESKSCSGGSNWVPMSRQSSAHAPSDRRVDLYGRARRVLRQVHLWIALVLCLPLVVLGATGSILVFRNELGKLLDPPPRLVVETGKPHTVAEIIAAVQARIDKEFTPFLYEVPNAPERPATLRLIALGGAAGGARIIDVLVD